MKSKLLFFHLVLTQGLFAQDFTEAPQSNPFDGVKEGSIAFADVDGDNDPDVLITGQHSSGTRISKLYTNDGSGSFTEMMGTPFEGVGASSIAFADVDGDNDPDVLITGQNNAGTRISKLYTNDGLGSYTEILGTPFFGVGASAIAFADVDGDNDPDVLLTGQNSSGTPISRMYTNDGLGNFTLKMGTPFIGAYLSAIAFADVDGDNDPDVLITGLNNTQARISKLYINDGSGSFAEKLGTTFENVMGGSVAFADVDGDNDPDVLITGENSTYARISKLYLNDGSGGFTLKSGTPFDGVAVSSIAFEDVDGDNDQDLFIAGNSSGYRISKLYTNDGSGNFTEKMGTPFEPVYFSSMAVADVDGDNDPDVLITGQNDAFAPISKLYINNIVVSSTDDLKTWLSLGFILYPNPSRKGMLYLSYDAKENGDVTVQLYNTNGVLLRQQKEFATIGQHVFAMDIASLPQGNYVVELYHGKRKGVVKFIVQ